uniref:Uncharacterized protein n=1 Tax=Arundo donax TaxID=35708 RepID=A0A0A9BPM6_ARUDO
MEHTKDEFGAATLNSNRQGHRFIKFTKYQNWGRRA